MKNFWPVLTGTTEASAEDLAGAIVEMERKIEAAKENVKKIEQDALELHQKRLCGETVSEKDIDLSERKVSTEQRNLKAAETTLFALQEKLKAAVATKIQKDLAVMVAERDALKNKKTVFFKEFIKKYAALKALQIFMNGPAIAEKSIALETISAEEKDLYKEEFSLQLSQLQKPSLWDEHRKLENQTIEYRDRTIGSVTSELLNAARNTN